MTTDDKISMLIRDLWIDDDFAESLAKDLGGLAVLKLCSECRNNRKQAVKDFCQGLMKVPRQKDRLAEIERKATEVSV